MKTIQTLFALCFVSLLAGCAGTDFKRPEPGALTVGKSTSAEVASVMGPPLQTGELLKNNQKVQTTRYGYAEGAGTGRYAGVTPARAMTFSTFQNLLVGQEFVSSFATDATDYDETKLPLIIKGKSTRADVVSILGKPNGEVIYPLIKNPGETGIIYSYSHVKGTIFNMTFYSKALTISFDNNNVVTDIDYTSTGQK
ncbi:hypothetical protein [Parvibium lacunae]|uniref:Outer membrane protein assembly factor BamE n=1 Tax=Parvibium lacunae TaxID=1888893 RepID=A0A368L0H0_9BURK|nr:hypothetical protein [Parvibium lacunae]RCS57036.1 hypothetical protein DU000_09520 [Parvibium lacunae]